MNEMRFILSQDGSKAFAVGKITMISMKQTMDGWLLSISVGGPPVEAGLFETMEEARDEMQSIMLEAEGGD